MTMKGDNDMTPEELKAQYDRERRERLLALERQEEQARIAYQKEIEKLQGCQDTIFNLTAEGQEAERALRDKLSIGHALRSEQPTDASDMINDYRAMTFNGFDGLSSIEVFKRIAEEARRLTDYKAKDDEIAPPDNKGNDDEETKTP